MRRLAAFVLIVLFVGSAGCGSECDTAGDCKSDQTCTDGKCVAREVPPPLVRRDGGPQPDAAARDATVMRFPDADVADSGLDAGGNGDGGPVRDGSVTDGGPRTDSGLGVERAGLIQVSSTQTATASETRYFGSFFEHGEPALINSFAITDGTCELIDRNGPRTRTRGFDGNGIRISGFLAGASASVTLQAISPGVFQPETPPMIFTLWPQGQMALTYAIDASNTADQVTTAMTTLPSLPSSDAPALIHGAVITANLATPVNINAASLDVRWTPVANSNVTFVAELSDRLRELVLRCSVPDAAGAIDVPLAARQAFLGRPTVTPYALELRYEQSKVIQVPLASSALTVPTTIRHSSGVRYRTTP